MSFWNSKKIKKTRKQHSCIYCGVVIQKGSSCNSETGTYEGDFNHYYLCERCVYWLDRITLDSCEDLGNLLDSMMQISIFYCEECGGNNMSGRLSDDKQSIDLGCNICSGGYCIDCSINSIKEWNMSD